MQKIKTLEDNTGKETYDIRVEKGFLIMTLKKKYQP
jgi:hypothetical protein